MSSSTNIAYSRLLYADYLYYKGEKEEVINKIKGFGFTESTNKGEGPTKFSIVDVSSFIRQIQSIPKSDSESLDYIKNIFFWIYDEGLLPLSVIVIEVILKSDELQKLNKSDLEKKIWDLSGLLGKCFTEGPIPFPECSKDLHILKFSTKTISGVDLSNLVAEFVIQEELGFFDDFNRKIYSLEKRIHASEAKKIHSKATAQQRKKTSDIRSRVISMEPVSFLDRGFSYQQSIVRGFANEMFIIGKIVQRSLDNSTPLYFIFLSRGMSQIPLDNLESMPVLQFPEQFPLLNFSSGAGQILMLQLLNSWNRYVEKSVKDITTKQSTSKSDANMDTDKTLDDLGKLIFFKGINEKISVNYLGRLNDLANPSEKTFLYEFPIPPGENSPYLTNPEKYGLEKPGPIVSNFASLILKNLDLNEKYLMDATDLRKSKVEVLKIEEDRKYSRRMLCLTVVIAVATIVNVFLFLRGYFR